MDTLDLFSGIGGFALACHRLGISTAQFVEKEPFCQQILSQRFPGIPIHDDITTFTAKKGDFDLITAGFPCFTENTLILSFDGYKKIIDLKMGDLVLSHTGQWQKITKLMVKENADLRLVQSVGTPYLYTTDDHPFFARTKKRRMQTKEECPDRSKRRSVHSFSAPEWIEACKLKANQSFVGQVLPPEIEDDHSIDFWKMVGLYIGDGWRVQRHDRPNAGKVVICANKTQAKDVLSIIQAAGFNASPSEERTVIKFHITNKKLYQFLEPFGHKANGKTIPGKYLGLSQPKAKSLFEGVLFADGWTRKDGTHSITTVSEKLAYSLALLAQKAFGQVASVHFADVPKTTEIEGRIVNQQPQFTVRISTSNPPKNSFTESNYGWKRVRSSIKTNTTGTVYNITVENDNSYIANGIIVHNCQDLSSANPNGRGLEGERSGLFFEVVRLIRTIQPRFVLLENVPNLLNRGLDRVLWELAQSGFDAEWQIVSAASMGAPHRRERVFIIAYAKGIGSEGKWPNHYSQGWQKPTGSIGLCHRATNDSTTPNPQGNGRRSGFPGDDYQVQQQNGAQGFEVGCGESATRPQPNQRPTKPGICGMDDGLSYWLDRPHPAPISHGSPYRNQRLKALGNSVVPQAVEVPLKRILELNAAFS